MFKVLRNSMQRIQKRGVENARRIAQGIPVLKASMSMYTYLFMGFLFFGLPILIACSINTEQAQSQERYDCSKAKTIEFNAFLRECYANTSGLHSYSHCDQKAQRLYCVENEN